MDLVTGGLGLIGGIAGLMNDSSSPALNLPTVDLSGITSNLSSSIPQLGSFNLGGQNYGQYGALLQNAVNNPYGGLPQGTANMFGMSGIDPALLALSNSNTLASTVPGLAGAAGSILSAGFDPQQALYKRTAQQVQDQTTANLSNSGLATTPWGQGVLGNTMSNFNIDWQNNLLGRMTTGAAGAEGLLGSAGSTASGALGLAGAAPNTAVGTAMLPWSTFNTLSANPLNLLSGGANYGIASSQIPQTAIGDWLSYMQGGNQANANAIASEKQQFNQNQVFGSQIGGGLSQMFGGGSGGFGGHNYGNSGSNAFWNNIVNPGSGFTFGGGF